MSTVRVTGILPAALESVQVTAAAAGDTVGYPVGLHRVEEERVEMIVPVYPDGRLEGGRVRLSFASGDIECEPRPFEIAALQPAPGTLRQVADDLQSLLAVHLRLIGGSTEALRAADPDTLVAPLVLLYLAQVLIDHLGNPAALRAGLDSHGSDDVPAAEELADALLAAMAIHENVRTAPARALREVFEQPVSAARLNAAPVFRLATYQQVSPAFTLPDSGGCTYPVRDAFTRPDAETLSCWMRLALYGEIATTGKPAVTYTVFTVALAAGEVVANMVPNPAARTFAMEATALATATALAYKLEMEAFSRLLPRRFVPNSLRMDLHPASFNEDDPGPGQWNNARIEAQSEGWTADRVVTDVILHTLRIPLPAEPAPPDPTAPARPGRIEMPAQRFGPVDITEEKWTDARISGQAVQHDLLAGRPFYRPHRVGESTIRISTKPGMFGVEYQEREEPLRLEAIEVLLSPRRSPVEPGEVRRIHIEVRNADDKRVEWDIEPATGHRMIVPGNEPTFIDVVTSGRQEDFPATLTVRSIADRSHLDVAPVRSGIAVLLPTSLTLEPAGVCVLPGERQRFTVSRPDIVTEDIVWEGGPDESENYRWSATAGSIDRNGEFRGPTTNGTATITAEDRENPSLRGELEVRYGEQCRFHWTLSIGGPRAGTYYGSQASSGIVQVYTPMAGDDTYRAFGLGVRRMSFSTERGTDPAVLIDVRVAPDEPGGGIERPGTYRLGSQQSEIAFELDRLARGEFAAEPYSGSHRSYNTGDGRQPDGVSPALPQPAVLTIDSIDHDRVIGVIEGHYWTLRPDGSMHDVVPVRINFRAPRCMVAGRGPCLPIPESLR